MRREGALGLFVVATVMIGTVGTPLELSGTLKACRLLRFEERLGNEVIGARPGIAKHGAQSIGIAQKRALWTTLDLASASPAITMP